MSAISQKKSFLAPRPRVPGKKFGTKLVRAYPEELQKIERAARKLKISSSRFIVEAALAAAGSPTVA
jgi:hypothetical protein